MTPQTKLLLISTSTVYGTGYLDHAEGEIRETMGDVRRMIFIPYALADRAAYAQKATARFASMDSSASRSTNTRIQCGLWAKPARSLWAAATPSGS
jgi:peptidase E